MLFRSDDDRVADAAPLDRAEAVGERGVRLDDDRVATGEDADRAIHQRRDPASEADLGELSHRCGLYARTAEGIARRGGPPGCVAGRPSVARRPTALVPPARLARVDRRLVGFLLIAVASAGFGSGPLFAKGVYSLGTTGFLTLLAWRFLFGAAASWAWISASASRRAAARRMARRMVVISLGLGVLYIGNSASY